VCNDRPASPNHHHRQSRWLDGSSRIDQPPSCQTRWIRRGGLRCGENCIGKRYFKWVEEKGAILSTCWNLSFSWGGRFSRWIKGTYIRVLLAERSRGTTLDFTETSHFLRWYIHTTWYFHFCVTKCDFAKYELDCLQLRLFHEIIHSSNVIEFFLSKFIIMPRCFFLFFQMKERW
jgi:hypothetical protein